MTAKTSYPVTPDGRYFVVNGTLWRASNPALDKEERQRLVNELMAARRRVGQALKAKDVAAEHQARGLVDACKRALGERGPVWWTDGAPDLNRHAVMRSPYAEWFAKLVATEEMVASSASIRPGASRSKRA